MSHAGYVRHRFQGIGHLEIRLSGGSTLGMGQSSPFVGIRINEEGRESYSLADPRGRAPDSFAMPRMAPRPRYCRARYGVRPGNLVRLQRSGCVISSVVIVPEDCTKTRRAPITIPLTVEHVTLFSAGWMPRPGKRCWCHALVTPLSCSRVNNALRRLTKAIGLEDVCLYTLRHTFVTRLSKLVDRCRKSPRLRATALLSRPCVTFTSRRNTYEIAFVRWNRISVLDRQ